MHWHGEKKYYRSMKRVRRICSIALTNKPNIPGAPVLNRESVWGHSPTRKVLEHSPRRNLLADSGTKRVDDGTVRLAGRVDETVIAVFSRRSFGQPSGRLVQPHKEIVADHVGMRIHFL